MADIISVIGGLIAGWFTKKKSKEEGSEVHKVLSPTLAIIVAAVVELIRALIVGDAINFEGLLQAGAIGGGGAIAIQSAGKNAKQFVSGKVAPQNTE